MTTPMGVTALGCLSWLAAHPHIGTEAQRDTMIDLLAKADPEVAKAVPVVIVWCESGIVQDAWTPAGEARIFVLDEDTLDGSGDTEAVEAFRERVIEAAYAVLLAKGQKHGTPNDLPWARRLIGKANEILGNDDSDEDEVVYQGSGGKVVGDHLTPADTLDLGDMIAATVHALLDCRAAMAARKAAE